MTNVRRLLAALLATGLALATSAVAAASNCKMVQVADWPVRSGRGVRLVEGAVNGQKISIRLDTGAETMILRSATDRLGLTRQQARGARLFGIGGETHVEVTVIDEFKVGQVTRKNWRLPVAGERDFGNRIDAIVGEDFFEQIDVEFDLPHNAVRLFQPKDCEGVLLAYWATQGASEVEMEPFYDAGPRIVLTVQINGQPTRALLDSGSSASVLDKSTAERLGITLDSAGVVASGKGGGLGSKLVDFWIAPLQTFAMDATYTPTASHLPRKVGGTPPVLLGADFLRAHRVLVAHSQRKVYFTYEGGPVFRPKAPPEARRASTAQTDTKAGAEAK